MLQKDLLLPWRTVTGNIVLGASLTGRATKRDRAEAVALAERYGLGEFVDHYPHALSGGMRQRVALMRTLAVHKDVMLLDEPFGALDSQTRLRMQQWLLDVWEQEGRTLLFITHDVDEAIFLSDRVLVMSARPGHIRAEFDVPLARPRGFELLTSEAFTDLKRRVLELLYSETIKASHSMLCTTSSRIMSNTAVGSSEVPNARPASYKSWSSVERCLICSSGTEK